MGFPERLAIEKFQMSRILKVAIVHYWFVTRRGGEKVVEELASIFPQADLFTHVLDRSRLHKCLADKTITTTFISSLPWAKRFYQHYLPLMPLALEQLDLRDYDLVISSESGPAKGVITGPDTLHLCYCHTPMRYVWDMASDYLAACGPVKKALAAPGLHYLRLWDRLSADRVDHFVANSENVRRRILKHYRREATVIHPPVDTESYHLSAEQDDYYLLAGQLVGYKRADLAVRAFNDFGRRLVVIGEGEELRVLRSMAGTNVEFLGRQPDHILSRYYARCRALIFPGEEDFGMVPVEAMAAGRPVIALARGGALETVIEGETGIFFQDQTVDSLRAAVLRFEASDIGFDPQRIREHALTFGRERFRDEIIKTVNNLLSR